MLHSWNACFTAIILSENMVGTHFCMQLFEHQLVHANNLISVHHIAHKFLRLLPLAYSFICSIL